MITMILKHAAAFLLFSIVVSTCNFNTGTDPDPKKPSVNRKFTDDTIAVSLLGWQKSESNLPACGSSSTKQFSMPDIPAPTGNITIIPSAKLQPVGFTEKMVIEVHVANGSTIDTSMHGVVTVDAGEHATVIKTEPMKTGTAQTVIRFNQAGLYTISVTLTTNEDTLFGTVTVMAFSTQLPVMELEIAEGDLKTILADPYEKIKVSAVLTYNGIHYPTEARLHGGSSRDYPKKSFRFDLALGLELPDTHDHIILRAEWNDKTMLRNFLSLECVRNGTWLPTPEAEMVHFRINQRYYGVMWRTERIGGDFLRIKGLNNTSAHLYEADPQPECFTPGGNLTPLPSDEKYRCAYSVQKGSLDYVDLIALIEETLQLPDEEFVLNVNDVVRVNDFLVYFAVMAIIQNQDHIKKNYYLYRDPELNDNRWTIFPWDLELTFGHLWTENNDVLDESIFTDEPLGFGAVTPPYNTLFSRLYAIPTYRQRFDEMVAHLIETVFTESFINERINNILCRASYDILADQSKRAKNDEYLSRVEELRNFVINRKAFIKNQEVEKNGVAFTTTCKTRLP